MRDADGTRGRGATRSPRRHHAGRLAEKEGLALINGTDGMLGMLALAIDDLGCCSPPPTSPPR